MQGKALIAEGLGEAALLGLRALAPKATAWTERAMAEVVGATEEVLPRARQGTGRLEAETALLKSGDPAGVRVPTLASEALGIRQVGHPSSSFEARTYSAFKDSTVRIFSTRWRNSEGGGQEIFRSHGSGTIVDGEGLILTNYHVIQASGTNPWIVTSNGRGYGAVPIARDRVADLALLRIRDAPSDMPAVKLKRWGACDISGDKVMGIGYPGTATEPTAMGAGFITRKFMLSPERSLAQNSRLSEAARANLLSPATTLDMDSATSIRRAHQIMFETDFHAGKGSSGGGVYGTYGEQVGIIRAANDTHTWVIPIDAFHAMRNAISTNIPRNTWYDVVTQSEIKGTNVSTNVLRATEIPWSRAYRLKYGM